MVTPNYRIASWISVMVSFAFPALAAEQPAEVARWGRFEQSFESSVRYTNPVQQAALRVAFNSPSGEKSFVYGFWDGGNKWLVRFSPKQSGKWTFATLCSDENNKGLHNKSGSFVCGAASGKTRFEQHGPLRVSADGYYLMHDDGTPFFWLGDTAWNGALLASHQDWRSYLQERVRQKFTAVQWVATQWRAAPEGDLKKELAYTGTKQIAINPEFFQRLDEKAEAVNQAGLLNVPVLLWTIASGSNPSVNPGQSLAEDQLILLARYMIARWQAHDVVWILAGDGHYFGQEGEKWKRVGRAVFNGIPHAPVSMHPQGRHWNWYDFKNEPWLGIIGYQSGHGDSDETLRWIFDGPPSKDWKNPPFRPFINLEPPYENHLAYQSKKPITPEMVRRAIYWSLLNAPTAGVTYGGHGVWGWDDGTKAPTDHANTGTPLPWKKALTMPAAEHMAHLYNFFTSIDFWRLRPMPTAIVNQPGNQAPRKYVAAARTDKKDVTVVYIPEDRTVEVLLEALPPAPEIRWINPRTGENTPAVAVVTETTCQFPTPGEGDWILYMYQQKK